MMVIYFRKFYGARIINLVLLKQKAISLQLNCADMAFIETVLTRFFLVFTKQVNDF